MGYGAEHVLRATTSVERRTGLMAQQPQPQHPSGLSMLGGELPGAQLPLPTPLPTTQQPLHHRHVAPLPAQHALHPKPQPVSPVRQAQQQQEQQMHAEMARLRQALADRVDEVSRLNTQASKLSKVREQDMEKLKNSLIRDREEKLAKQSAAHNKRLVAKEEEMAALKASMTKEKDKVCLIWTGQQQQPLTHLPNLLLPPITFSPAHPTAGACQGSRHAAEGAACQGRRGCFHVRGACP
jgi:hypothetical protein